MKFVMLDGKHKLTKIFNMKMTTASKSSTTSKTASQARGTVKAKSTAAHGLHEFFVEQLKDIYWAEKALVKALPKMAKNATSKNLVAALTDHLAVTEGHVTRVETIFEMLGKTATAKKCDAMEGLLKEGEGILEETEPGAVRDAGIIASSQKIEHYEIASYGTMCSYAKTLGQDEIAKLLHKTLLEEKEADVALTDNAYNHINFDAIENQKN